MPRVYTPRLCNVQCACSKSGSAVSERSIRWADWPSDQPDIPDHCWPVPYGAGLLMVPKRSPVPATSLTWPYHWRESLVTLQSYWHRLSPLVCGRFGVPKGTWELSPVSVRWSIHGRRKQNAGIVCVGCTQDLTDARYVARLSWGRFAWCSECAVDRIRAPVILGARWPYGLEHPASHRQGILAPPDWEQRARLPWASRIWGGLPTDPNIAQGIVYWRRSL